MKSSRTIRSFAALVACVLWPVAASAQETQPAPAAPAQATTQPAAAPAGPPPIPFFTGFVDMQFTTAYYKRGFLLEDHGLIWQPMVDFSVNPYHSDGFLTDLSFDMGTRESVHTNDTDASRSPRAWAEGDFWLGNSATFLHRAKLDTQWVDITSPNAFFQTIQEWDWKLTFLDDGMLGDVTIHPYALFVKETAHSAVAGPLGNYLELGLEPAFPLIKSKTFPVRLSFPTRVGMSVKNYYKLPTPVGVTNDETYGFTEAGISAMMPVTFIPHDFGMVILTTGVDFLFLDHNLTLVNRNNGDAVIGRIGLTWLF